MPSVPKIKGCESHMSIFADKYEYDDDENDVMVSTDQTEATSSSNSHFRRTVIPSQTSLKRTLAYPVTIEICMLGLFKNDTEIMDRF